MNRFKRVFLIVADSLGVGAAPDAEKYFNGDGTDEGCNTYKTVSSYNGYSAPNLDNLGMKRIMDLDAAHAAACGKMKEASAGKDTVTGHFEICGVVTDTPMPTFPDGFPVKLLNDISDKWGRGWLCNKPYSGTDVIRDYGRKHIESGDLIVYTSSDSVFQIAAHEEIVPVDKLYEYCEIARSMLIGKYGVGRVIARPFTGDYPDYIRTPNRRDYSLECPKINLCDLVSGAGMDVIGVGKIGDIFAHRGITKEIHTESNMDGINQTLKIMENDFTGLCFVNLVDFDMKYGHRRDIKGYAEAVMEFDSAIPYMLEKLREDDALFICADHGCDPGHIGTDHTREYVPLLGCSNRLKNVYLGALDTFADLGKTIAEMLCIDADALSGKSFLKFLM